MSTCSNCLYQGDRNVDAKGNTNIFCLVRANWFSENKTCDHFKEYADISKEMRAQLALDLRNEEAEDKRLRKLSSMNLKFFVVTVVVSFALFWLTIKLFDKYIF